MFSKWRCAARARPFLSIFFHVQYIRFSDLFNFCIHFFLLVCMDFVLAVLFASTDCILKVLFTSTDWVLAVWSARTDWILKVSFALADSVLLVLRGASCQCGGFDAGFVANKKTRRPVGRRESKSVSRVLYWMIIYLGAAVTGRLERSTLHRNARRAAASKVHMILHRIGFTWPHNRLCAGELLPRLSTLTRVCGRYLSVALSLGSPPPDVIRYPALWCTDFPRAEARDHLIYFFPSIRKKRLCRKRTGAFWLDCDCGCV